MRKILFAFLCLISASAYSQNLPNSGFDKVRLTEPDKVVQAELTPVASKPHLKKTLFYAWYSADVIHSTQGGYSGRLLNGKYNEFYLNKNLKEQGLYKNGLKTGPWKSWKEDGSLAAQVTWKNGTILPDSTISFWKKLPFFGKRKKQPDTSISFWKKLPLIRKKKKSSRRN